MKKLFFDFAIVATLSLFLQGCSGDPIKPVGVIQFDSANQEIITSYNWFMVDTTGGFTTMPTGFKAAKNNHYGTLLEEKQIKWVEDMLITFQKRFKVKLTNYQIVPVFDTSQAYVTVFFEPAVNPVFDELKEDHQDIMNYIEDQGDIIGSLWEVIQQQNKQIKEIKKLIEEKK